MVEVRKCFSNFTIVYILFSCPLGSWVSLWNFETITGSLMKVSKGAKIRNRYNQAPHLTQDTNGKVTTSQLDTTNESQEVSPFPKWQKLASLAQDICIL